MGPANAALDISIDHDLYNQNRYYRRLVNCWAAVLVRRVEVLRVHFKCRLWCCEDAPRAKTIDRLLNQIWLDNPAVHMRVVVHRVKDWEA